MRPGRPELDHDCATTGGLPPGLRRLRPCRGGPLGPAEIEALLGDATIIRNRRKIEAAVQNARAFVGIQEEFGSFARYVWRFVGGAPRIHHWRSPEEVPSSSPESTALSRDLKQRGFTFVGPTICYAYMQATGMVNDHLVDCFRHAELAAAAAGTTVTV